MRIAMIRLDLSWENGDNRMFLSIAQTLQKLGHEVMVYTAQVDPACFPELKRGLKVRLVPPRRKLRPISGAAVSGLSQVPAKIFERVRNEVLYKDAALRIARVLEPGFDLVIAQNDHSYQIGVDYKKRSPDSRFVWVMNNAPFYHLSKANPIASFLSRLWAFLQELTVKKYAAGVDLVVVNDRGRAEMVRRTLGLPVRILRIGVDFPGFFRPVKKRKPGDGKIVLLGVGSLSPARRFEDIISAAALLRRKGYDARVILVCGDVAGDWKYKRTLLDLSEREGVRGFVDFRFDGASEEELKRLQAASDIFVFPNRIDIWGMSAFEAMAAGLPLVVSRTTSVAEVLKEDENAVFVEPMRPDEIAAKAMGLIDNPARCGKIAAAGQKFVKENLDWGKYARSLLEAVKGMR